MGDSSETTTDPARIAILIVSDYAGGEEKSWNDLRLALKAWRDQLEEFDSLSRSAFTWWLVESSRLVPLVPGDLFELLPGLRLLSVEAESSYALKNAGVEATQADWVALVDADCVPAPGWLRRLQAAIAADPGLAAVSGITTYPGRNRLERFFGLLDRSYAIPARSGPGYFISGNAAAYRTNLYLRYPLTLDLGPFAGRMQSEAMIRDGLRFHVDLAMRTVHDFEGWRMERDIRRQHGFATVITRLRDRRMPQSWLVRLGPMAIPAIVLGKTLLTLADAWRCHALYGVRGVELPLALLLCPLLHVLEIPGMVLAYSGRQLSDTAYR